MTFRPFALLLLIFLAACAAVPPVDEGKDPLEGFSSAEAALNHHLTLGDIALNQRDYAAAADSYLLAMQLTDDGEIAEQATRLALHTGRNRDALRAAQQWQGLVVDDTRPREAEVIAALRLGDLDRAYRSIMLLMPDWNAPDESAFRSLARLLLDEDDRAAAVELLQRAALQFDTGPAWEVTALAALRANDDEVARSAIAKARRLTPESPQAAMLEARILTLTGDEAQGIALMRAIVAEHPDDPTLRFTLGGLYLNLRRFDEARATLEEVVETAPAYMDARWTLALLLLQLRDTDAAEPHLMAALADPVRRWDVPFYMGGLNELREDWATAFEWFEQVEWGDNLHNARIKSAQMLFRLDRIDEARARLAALRDDNQDDRMRLYRIEAELLTRVGHGDEALQVLNEAVDVFPGDAAVLYTRALTLEQLGRYQEAIDDLRRVNVLMPDNAEAQNALGYVMADRGEPHQWPEALQLIQRALAEEPENAAFIDSKGWVLYRLGQLENARLWLEHSWELDKNPEVAAHLGEVLWMLGDTDGARAAWAEAAEVDAQHPVLVETLQRLTGGE